MHIAPSPCFILANQYDIGEHVELVQRASQPIRLLDHVLHRGLDHEEVQVAVSFGLAAGVGSKQRSLGFGGGDICSRRRPASAITASSNMAQNSSRQSNGAGGWRVGSRRGPTAALAQRCLTRDTLWVVSNVSIRDLRNHGGDVVDRAARGEPITITRSGRAVAELRAVLPPPLAADTLLSRWRRLPRVDPVVLRADIDRLLDSGL